MYFDFSKLLGRNTGINAPMFPSKTQTCMIKYDKKTTVKDQKSK